MSKRSVMAAVTSAAPFALCAVLIDAPPLALGRLALLGAALGSLVESDLTERRIPNRIVIPAAAMCAGAWAASGVSLFALLDGLALVAILLALSLFSPEALGMGDVKLALLLVVGLDGRGAFALLVALALAASLGIVVLLRYGRAGARRQVPLAPFFAAGALLALLA